MRAAQEPRKSAEAMDHLTKKLAPHALGSKSCRKRRPYEACYRAKSCPRSTKTGQWDKDGSSGISNLESARGEQVWLMAREELQPQRPGGLARRTSLELVVRRALSVRRRIVAWRARPSRAAMSMMPWIRERAHHLLAAATWELDGR